MNYTQKENHCRIDIWKESGKWYTTEEVVFRKGDYKDCLIHDALKHAIMDDEYIRGHYKGMRITCLQPYHQYSHPISIVWEG